jgi:cyclophilin family peptidyl-prolyl cis-trans isomerase
MPVASKLTGKTLNNRYIVLRPLGEGGMGKVYLAKDKRFDKQVVVKVPTMEVGDKDFKDRFMREIVSLATLEHPHIVPTSDWGEIEGLPFLVLRYLNGGNLRNRITDLQGYYKPMPLERLNEWLPQIASAVDFIHSKNWIHRDLKPDNILFDEAGNSYLADFGIAKALEGTPMGVKTTLGTLIGTPQYMAPEMHLGKGVGPRADQFSLGVMIYETLAGKIPFAGETPTAIFVEMMQGKVKPIHELVPGIPLEKSNALMKGITFDPRDRYGSCVDFANAIMRSMLVREWSSASAETPPMIVIPETKIEPTKKADFLGSRLKTSVKVTTSKGEFIIELDEKAAPITVKNFLSYVDEKFYDGTIFHRVIKKFMIQGGGFNPGMNQKATKGNIKNESFNGLTNLRGTIAMARTPDPDSASSQFFINVKDNGFLDKANSGDGAGYCVFGKVTSGMEVLDTIEGVQTGNKMGHGDVPNEDISILSVIKARETKIEPTKKEDFLGSRLKTSVKVNTSKGEFTIELDEKAAPITVTNFLSYVEDKFFDGTIFHRVIKKFMIQGGGFNPGMKQKATKGNIKNESFNGLTNQRGTIAMARTPDPDSASSQFFINVKDNDFLNRANSGDGAGYCVFGKVTSGMEILDTIEGVKTGNKMGHGDVPNEDITILSVIKV